jgi:hypothetical protein
MTVIVIVIVIVIRQLARHAPSKLLIADECGCDRCPKNRNCRDRSHYRSW